MNNINAQKRMEAIDYLFKQIDVGDARFEAQLTYFLLVAVYGAAQYCIKTIFIDWINPAIKHDNLKKIENKIDKMIQTPSLSNIKDLLLISNRTISLDTYSVYNRILNHRHLFAHGEKDPTKLEGVTMSDIKLAFSELKQLLEVVEKKLYE